MKTERELTELLEKLISRWEDEVVEFKEGGAGFSTHDIGKYFSALSNEANLRDASNGWLVFGVNNKQRLLIDFLRRFNGSSRAEINEFMLDEIRGDFSKEQKISKIGNILTSLRRNGVIRNNGTDTRPQWFLIDSNCEAPGHQRDNQ